MSDETSEQQVFNARGRRRQSLPEGMFSADAQALIQASEETEQKFIALQRERNRQQQEAIEAANDAALKLAEEARLLETLSEEGLREQLHEAIAARSDAYIQLGIAEENEQRACQRMQNADIELLDYADLDAKIADWNVRQIKRNLHDQLPSELAQAQRQRGIVIDQLDAAHKAHDVLQGELNAAQNALRDRDDIRARAAAHVIAKYIDTLAAQLDVAIATMVELQRKIITAGSLWVSNPNGPMPLRLSATAINMVHRQLEEPCTDPTYMHTIREWHTRLLDDLRAEIEP